MLKLWHNEVLDQVINLAMFTSPQALKHDLDQLTSEQLQQVADFIAFLKFRDKNQRRSAIDPAQLAALMNESVEEDAALAEAGMNDYAAMLEQEEA
jgi:hypothetical protein